MSTLVIETIGYTAAVVTNISVYPQAYEVYVIVQTRQYTKLNTLSITTFSLQTVGCFFWLSYALIQHILPVIFGSIMCIIPSTYILFNLIYFNNQHSQQPIEVNNETLETNDHTEIIIASDSVYPIQEIENSSNFSLNIDTDLSTIE